MIKKYLFKKEEIGNFSYYPNISVIYCIYNKVNNKKYIGSAINFRNRVNDHRKLLVNNKHCNKILQRSFSKHGIDNFRIIILEIVLLKEKLIEREQYWIDIIKPKYNIRKIAESNLGIKYSEESCLKISISNTGRKASEETKQKISKLHKGRKRSKETCENISKSLTGKKLSKSHRISLCVPKKNKDRYSKNIIQMDKNNNIIKIWYNGVPEISEQLCIKRSTLSMNICGKNKFTKGFNFKRESEVNFE